MWNNTSAHPGGIYGAFRPCFAELGANKPDHVSYGDARHDRGAGDHRSDISVSRRDPVPDAQHQPCRRKDLKIQRENKVMLIYS